MKILRILAEVQSGQVELPIWVRQWDQLVALTQEMYPEPKHWNAKETAILARAILDIGIGALEAARLANKCLLPADKSVH